MSLSSVAASSAQTSAKRFRHESHALRSMSLWCHTYRDIIAIGAVLLLAAWFYLTALGYGSLSHAEAWRANWTDHGGLAEARRFPPLQYAILWGVQHFLGRSEVLLRLPSAIAALLCIAAVFGFMRRHVDKASAVLAACAIAAHPVIFAHARELKVFSIEALATTIIFWTATEAYRSRSSRALYLFLAAALTGLSLTFTAALVIVGWLPLLAWRHLRGEAIHHYLRCRFFLVTLVIGMAGIGWYVWLAGCPLKDALVGYYYNTIEPVWPHAYAPASLAKWFVIQSYGAMCYLLGISVVWPPLNWVIGTMECLALVAGIGVLRRKCPSWIAAIGAIVTLTVAAGAMRLWPFGNIRHTTFLTPLVAIAIGTGLAHLARRLGRGAATVFVVTVCLLVPAARLAKATLTTPVVTEHVRPVYEYVKAHLQPGDALFVYYPADDAFAFYWEDPSVPVLVEPRSDRGDLALFSHRFDAWILQHKRVWYVSSHDWKDERQRWIAHLKQTYPLVDEWTTQGASVQLFTPKLHHDQRP